MKQNQLGITGIKVSELCFGTLTLGPLQKNLPLDEGLKVLTTAYENGINFYDTADMYNTYSYLRELLKIDHKLIICSRSYDYSKEGLRKSLERALRELDRDYIDLFLLHEQESRYTFEGHQDAFEELYKAKKEGKIRATGFSTHRIEAVRDALDFNELEVIFPLINKFGLGIEDGSAYEMLKAITKAKEKNKGIFTMKPLGGGNLINQRSACLEYQKDLLKNNLTDSIAIGMGTESEVLYNINYFNGKSINKKLDKKTLTTPRYLHIDDWCEQCGNCVKRCHQNALEQTDKGIKIDHNKCLRCGYCASVCPVFAIKVV